MTDTASTFFNENSKTAYYLSSGQVTIFGPIKEEDLNEKGKIFFTKIQEILKEPGKKVDFIQYIPNRSGSWTADEKSPFYRLTQIRYVMNSRDNFQLRFKNIDGLDLVSSTIRYKEVIDGKSHIITISGSHYVY